MERGDSGELRTDSGQASSSEKKTREDEESPLFLK